MSSIKERIQKEMLADYASALEKHFDVAKILLRITNDGKVEILNKDKLNLEDQLSLYFVGKIYAKEGEYSSTDRVDNTELKNELGISDNSLFPTLKKLRDTNKIKQDSSTKPVSHYMPINFVENVLTLIAKKNRNI